MFQLPDPAPAIIGEGEGEGDDLFVVVSWESYSQCFTSILQIDMQAINHEYDPNNYEAPVIQSEFSATFRLPKPQPVGRTPIQWGYALLADGPTKADLHIVPDWDFLARDDTGLHSCLFNLKTKECKRIKPPNVRKDGGHVFALGDYTYFMAHPTCCDVAPDPSFERYNHLNDEWEILQPIPQDAIFETRGAYGSIGATALWDDTILFNVFGDQFWVYNVDKRKWYQVEVDHPWECEIVGEAFVRGNTIYALSQERFDSVAALSIRKEVTPNGDDLVYKCSLSDFILVPVEGRIELDYEDEEESQISRHLVHLGGDNFCLVRSCKSLGDVEYQQIQLTHLKFDQQEKSMTVTNTCVHHFKPVPYEQFAVRHCFSLPKSKTTDLKQGKTLFEFDPLLEYEDKTDVNLECEVVKPVQEEENVTLPKDGPLFGVQGANSELDAKSNVALKASTISAYEKASERSNTDEEGHSICVRFSSQTTVKQLVDKLKIYGPIMKVEILVATNTTLQEKPCAYVEFESAASKRLAIEASPITIGECRAVIQNIKSSVPPAVHESLVSDGGNHVYEVPPVPEVVDGVQDDSFLVVESDSKVEEVRKESYANIAMRSPFLSPAPVVGKSQKIEAGFSIYIKGLSMTDTLQMLVKAYEKFGPIMTGNIEARQGFCLGVVEFLQPTSVEKALEASPIEIRGRKTYVEREKPRYPPQGKNKKRKHKRGKARSSDTIGDGGVRRGRLSHFGRRSMLPLISLVFISLIILFIYPFSHSLYNL